MPGVDAVQIGGGGGIPDWQVEFDDLRCRPLVFCADRPAQIGKIGLVRPLARKKHQVTGLQSPDRLKGQMIRIAGANADQGKVCHLGSTRTQSGAPGKGAPDGACVKDQA